MQLVFVHCPIFYRLSQRIWSDHDQRLPTNRTVFALFRTTIDKAGRQIIIWYGLPHNNAKGVTQYINRIYVTGHRNPDTDSIAAAISYAALRNALGNRDYVAAHLGHISDETKRLLDRFGFQEPVTISNVRTQVRDMDFDTPPALNSSVTMDRAWHIMRDQDISAMPIINEDGTL